MLRYPQRVTVELCHDTAAINHSTHSNYYIIITRMPTCAVAVTEISEQHHHHHHQQQHDSSSTSSIQTGRACAHFAAYIYIKPLVNHLAPSILSCCPVHPVQYYYSVLIMMLLFTVHLHTSCRSVSRIRKISNDGWAIGPPYSANVHQPHQPAQRNKNSKVLCRHCCLLSRHTWSLSKRACLY